MSLEIDQQLEKFETFMDKKEQSCRDEITKILNLETGHRHTMQHLEESRLDIISKFTNELKSIQRWRYEVRAFFKLDEKDISFRGTSKKYTET